MEIKKREIEQHIIGVQSAKQFGISNNAVIFDILRKNMYTNPISAICREIASNARDANIEAGRADMPIIIKVLEQGDDSADAVLGLSGDLMISFCDSGIGISPDRMDNIFLMYGESTKRGDNMQTGGWGLGAKTPFAYSDSFSIITVNEEHGVRTKYFYTAALDEEMRGTMYLVHSQETDEETGTSITLPIKSVDRANFEKYCRFYTEYWDVPARLIAFAQMPEPKRILRFSAPDGCEFEIRQSDSNNSEDQILIAGIPYPATHYHIPKLQSGHISIKFPVGVLDISANREYVKDVQGNTDLMKNKIMSMVKYAHEWVTDYMSNIPTKLEAMLKMYLLKMEDFGNNLPDDEFTLYAMFQIVKNRSNRYSSDDNGDLDANKFKWNGEDIDVNSKLRFHHMKIEDYEHVFTSRRNHKNGTANFLQMYHNTRKKDGTKSEIYLCDGTEDRIRQRFHTIFKEKLALEPHMSMSSMSTITYRLNYRTPQEYAHSVIGGDITQLEAEAEMLRSKIALEDGDEAVISKFESKKVEYEKALAEYKSKLAEEVDMLAVLFDLKEMMNVTPTRYDDGIKARRKPDAPVKIQYIYSNMYNGYRDGFALSCGSKIDELKSLQPGEKPTQMSDFVMFEVPSVGVKSTNCLPADVETKMKFIHFICKLIGRTTNVIAAAISKKSIMELGGAMRPDDFFLTLTPKDLDVLRSMLYAMYINPTIATMSTFNELDFPEKNKITDVLKLWKPHKNDNNNSIKFDAGYVTQSGDDARKFGNSKMMYNEMMSSEYLATLIGKEWFDGVENEMVGINEVINKYPLLSHIELDRSNSSLMNAINHYIRAVNAPAESLEPVELETETA